VVGAEFAGDDVPVGGFAETAGTDPSTTSARVVTIAVAGTSPLAGVTPPPATSTVVIKPRALKLKKSGMKKSSLQVQLFVHNVSYSFSTSLMI
jgi:hypothetical protein